MSLCEAWARVECEGGRVESGDGDDECSRCHGDGDTVLDIL